MYGDGKYNVIWMPFTILSEFDRTWQEWYDMTYTATQCPSFNNLNEQVLERNNNIIKIKLAFKSEVMSCHEPSKKPLGLQPFPGVGVHWCCDPNDHPWDGKSPPYTHSGDITQSSVHDFVKIRSKGLEIEVMMKSSSYFQVWSARLPLVITETGPTLRRQPPSPLLPTVPSTHAVAVPQGLGSPTVKLLDTWPRLQLTLDRGPEFGSRGPGPVSLQASWLNPHATRPIISELAGKLTKTSRQSIDSIQTKPAWTLHSNNHPSSGFPQNSEHIILTGVKPNGPTAVGQERKGLENLGGQNRPSGGPGTKTDFHHDYKFLT